MLLDGLGERALGEAITQTSFKLVLGAGIYTLTGEQVKALKGSLSGVQAGFYTLTGENAALKKGSLLSATAGFYTLTGNSLVFAIIIDSLQAGFYGLTGNSLTLTFSTGRIFIPPSPPQLFGLDYNPTIKGTA